MLDGVSIFFHFKLCLSVLESVGKRKENTDKKQEDSFPSPSSEQVAQQLEKICSGSSVPG